MGNMYARLIPYNPRLGFFVRGYNYRSYGFVGGERPNWYEIDDALYAELKDLRQVDSDPRAQPLFQFCTPEEKEKIEQDEQGRYLSQLGIASQTMSIPKEFATPNTIRLATPEAPPPITAQPAVPTQTVDRAGAVPAPRVAGRRTGRATLPGAITSADVTSSDIATEPTPAATSDAK